MGDNTFFFYGTLMVPAILHRVIHGQSTPEPWQESLLTTRPALLPGYQRYRVQYADYPGILPAQETSSSSPSSSSVLGVVVTGLTEGDVYRLDEFEGSEYTKHTVKVKVAKNIKTDDEDGDEALKRGLVETAHLADASETEMEEVEATTYVWSAPESFLELNSEWDFESFKRDKLQHWIVTPVDEL